MAVKNSHSTDSSVSDDEGHSYPEGNRRSRGKTEYSSESGDFKRALSPNKSNWKKRNFRGMQGYCV